jgi:hypothetical protein
VADLLLIALMIAFFAVAVLLVRACDAVIGPDTEVSSTSGETYPEDRARRRAA